MDRKTRKTQKKRKKEFKKKFAERKLAETKRILAKARARYPSFAFTNTNAAADTWFVKQVKDIIETYDFEDDTKCSPICRRVFAEYKRLGRDGFVEMVDIAAEQNLDRSFDKHMIGLTASHVIWKLSAHIGDYILSRLPSICRDKPLPNYYFLVTMGEDCISIDFQFLTTKSTEKGILYYSPLEPTVHFAGIDWIVAYSRHAIERLCLRNIPKETIDYEALVTQSLILSRNIRYEPIELVGGQPAARIYQECDGINSLPKIIYRDLILGDENYQPEQGLAHYILGYCPLGFSAGKAVATTFLYPGYKGTPEDTLMRTADIPKQKRSELLDAARHNSASRVFSECDIELIRWYHENGVPQVVQLKGGTMGRAKPQRTFAENAEFDMFLYSRRRI